jgi:hypothetical protein
MMPELKIEQLQLHIENAAGHEHRIPPITERAMSILAERWSESAAGDSQEIENLSVPPIDLNLDSMSDEQAAQAIAGAIFEGLGR